MSKRCYKKPTPGVDLEELSGLLVVLEGPDSSGRSTQVSNLSKWLEKLGFPVAQVGIKRSNLVSKELETAKQGNVLSPLTMSLFYATDFYDQLENKILGALRAGFIVLADRYIFTLMARDVVRGADPEYLESVYSMAIVPDEVFFLETDIDILVDRTLESKKMMAYWESGMDLGLSRSWHESFRIYQRRLAKEFARMSDKYDFVKIDSNREVKCCDETARRDIARLLLNTEMITESQLEDEAF
ncbi:MAG: thymidylate kinase [Planctomycetota bacterium]|nr:thymidylate kinase [Planctomycetota bacterium]